jgi:hypothetical protein
MTLTAPRLSVKTTPAADLPRPAGWPYPLSELLAAGERSDRITLADPSSPDGPTPTAYPADAPAESDREWVSQQHPDRDGLTAGESGRFELGRWTVSALDRFLDGLAELSAATDRLCYGGVL